MPKESLKLPQYALIKQYLQGQIESGERPVGSRIQSENELATLFSVSRMTARRALQELADEGLLSRAAGSGSFVTKPELQAPQLEILDPLERAHEAGTYSNRLLSMESIAAHSQIAELMHLSHGQTIYQLIMVHLEQGQPLLLQQLWVNPALAPALPKQTFNKITPDAYLGWLAPSTSVDHQLMAITPSASQRRELALTEESSPACIQLNRRCWRPQQVLSVSQSIIPTARYKLGQNLL